MQKHWKMIVALMLALMMLMSSVGMAEGNVGALSGTGDGVTEGAPAEEETTAAPEVTEVPEVTTAPEVTAAPEVTEAPEGTEAPEVTAVPEVTETPEVTMVPPVQPTPEASEAPAGEPENGATEEAPVEGAEGEATDAPEDDMEDAVDINPEDAETAATPEPTEAPPERPIGREIWVAMNTSMKDLSDSRAMTSNLMAKFLLARAVADNAPVGVFMMRKATPEVFEGHIKDAAEWQRLMETLDGSGFTRHQHGSIYELAEIMEYLNDENMKDKDLWLLFNQAKVEGSLQRTATIERVLKSAGLKTTIVRIQRSDDKLDERNRKEGWLDERILAANIAGDIETQTLYYDKVSEDPIAAAMDVFGLNLLAPLTEITTNEAGVCTWTHEGLDTLLVIDTDKKGVQVTAGSDVQAGSAFPVVIPVSDKQCMVLLRSANPGTYLVEGQVSGLTAAYAIDTSVTKPLVQETRTEGEPWVWYLEDQTLRVSVNLPQVRPGDLGKSVCIVREQPPVVVPEPMDETMPELSSDEETAEQSAEEEQLEQAVEASQELPEAEMVFVTVPQDRITEISGDKSGYVWEVVIPREKLGKGKICFQLNVNGFVIQSDVYEFEVIDRQLECSAGNAANLNYYYNVPGQADAPISEELAPYFNNPDQQKLNYKPAHNTTEYTIEDGVFQYHRGENTEDKRWFIAVDDGVSNPVEFTVAVKMVDFMTAVAQWKANMAAVEYQVTLGEEAEIAFALPAEYVAFYQGVQKQYPELPENLTDALKVTAVLTDSRYPSGWPLEVVFTQQEDGSLMGKVVVPAYTEQEDLATVTFYVDILGTEIADRTIVDTCTITVPNDKPAIANAAMKELKFKVGIHGAPDAREPLNFAAINGGLKEDAVRLPEPFVPADLFVDQIHLDGLRVTIAVDQPELVQLKAAQPAESETEPEPVQPGVAGEWVLDYDASEQAYVLEILDEGTVTVTISATDGECEGEESIVWTFQVYSVYDLILLIMIISASVLTVLIIVLLVLRQIRKPSFARSHSVMHMRMCTQYSPNGPSTSVPMDVYGKKETNLAKLFIACQQTPVTSLPMDVLADVAIYPGKRRSYRMVLGKRAENLSISVANMAQPTNKPVTFNQDQTVNVYADGNEVIFFMISSGS